MRLFAIKILLYELVLAWERNRVNWLFAKFPFLRRPRLFGAAHNPFVFEAAARICAFSAGDGEPCRFHHFAKEILRFIVKYAVDKHSVFFDHSLRVVTVSSPRFLSENAHAVAVEICFENAFCPDESFADYVGGLIFAAAITCAVQTFAEVEIYAEVAEAVAVFWEFDIPSSAAYAAYFLRIFSEAP